MVKNYEWIKDFWVLFHFAFFINFMPLFDPSCPSPGTYVYISFQNPQKIKQRLYFLLSAVPPRAF